MWQAGRTLSPLARRVIDISVSVAGDVAKRRASHAPTAQPRRLTSSAPIALDGRPPPCI